MPILEAQAMGNPVVTSALEPMQSIAGDGAILVNPYSVEELADAVKVTPKQEIFSDVVKAGLINVERYSVKSISPAIPQAI